MEFDSRPEVLKPVIQAIMFVLVNENRQVLLEKRVQEGKSYFGTIIVPGGKVDLSKGENRAEAVFREADEEYFIDMNGMYCLGSFESITPSPHHYSVTVYHKEVLQRQVKNMEPEKHEPVWVEIEEAEKGLIFAKDILAIKMTREFLTR